MIADPFPGNRCFQKSIAQRVIPYIFIWFICSKNIININSMNALHRIAPIVPFIALLCLSGCNLSGKKSESFNDNNSSSVDQIAFPGAEGAGKYARGGRGGDVYHVTNLNDSGNGSFREAIETIEGPRTIVFDICGIIRLERDLIIDSVSNLTIAGQTAPGKGITLADYPLRIKNSNNIIARYFRVRLGDENKPPDSGLDCIEVNYNENIILDHLSLSWGIDGNGDFRGLKNATLQWIIFSEALNNSLHEKGSHAMCTSFRQPKGPSTMHHNIYASSRNRHPTTQGGPGVMEFINNVDYNWKGHHNIDGERINIIANYYRAGPSTEANNLPVRYKSNAGTPPSKGYLAKNYFEGLPRGFNEDNYNAMDYGESFGTDSDYMLTTRKEFEAKEAFDAGEFKISNLESAEEAYQTCLKYSGCSLQRDLVDIRLINTIVDNTGKIIDSQSEVGAWDFYQVIARPSGWDKDLDGMPDKWEDKMGLDPNNPEDRNGDLDHDGFTNLEEYLNGLV